MGWTPLPSRVWTGVRADACRDRAEAATYVILPKSVSAMGGRRALARDGDGKKKQTNEHTTM
eukprot:5569967-Pyramimonas_sp.AAC.1